MLKKIIRTLAHKHQFFLKAFSLLNIITLPKKLYINYCIKNNKIPQLPAPTPSPAFIVSLTSYGSRVEKTLPYSLFTILSQSRKPSKIAVWLDETKWNSENIPPALKAMRKAGVDFFFCKDIGAYTKLVPSLRAFPNSVIITADDDLYYPKNWLAQLLEAHIASPKKIQIHRAHQIAFHNNRHEIKPYAEWKHAVKKTSYPQNLFITGVGGVLYPPNALGDDGTNEDLFLRLSPKNDDIWFWAAAKAKGTEFALVKNGYRKLKYINIADELSGLTVENVINNRNDSQIKSVVEHYLSLGVELF